MSTPDESPREPDSLAGSPELFATNLLLVRAIDNRIERITMERTGDAILVQLFEAEREHEPETLTEDTGKWDSIVERFEDYTRPEKEASGEGTVLEPNIPSAENVDEIRIQFTSNQLEITFDH